MNVPNEVIDFAGSTGNNFHSKVVRVFRDEGWHTRVSPYYLDGATNRAREIDLIAENVWNVPSGRSWSRLHMKLFIECKYVAENTVFWFDARDSAAAREWLVRKTPLPNPDNQYTAKHHYLAGESMVAKLFGTQPKKANRANLDTEREPVYKALNQALHSMVYLRGKGTIVPAGERGRATGQIVELPVIVVNSFEKFFRVNMGNLNEVAPIDANFQLEVNYAYLDAAKKNQSEYFLVDVVALDKVNAFFTALDSDAEAMKPFLEVLESRG